MKITETQMIAAIEVLDNMAAGLRRDNPELLPLGAALHAGAYVLCERDQLYARCPVLESDITPAHTSTGIETFALANGWTEAWRDENWVGIDHGEEGCCIDRLNRPEQVALFCNLHADLTGTPPLDVLKAIGEMP